ncbi:MAG: DUF3822 family protein [Cytophagales bacterium]|nr:DUF3822 family protein [Cytophagales bacterium]
MTTAKQPDYRLIKRVKDPKFEIDNLHHYSLVLQIGINDFQLCVIDGRSNGVLYFEDFKLENIKTVNTRLKVLHGVFDSHHFLTAGFWKSVKVSIKSHKFSLVPKDHFVSSSSSDYLVINSEVKPNIEEVIHYEHGTSGLVNVFAVDKKLLGWIKSIYPAIAVSIVHQGSALIEGLQKNIASDGSKKMYCNVDRGILHIIVMEGKNLLYYNQFAARQSEDYLKYVMTVFKEVGLSPKKNGILMWGTLKAQSKHVDLLKKYFKDIEYAGKARHLVFSHAFDEIPEYHYFDTYGAYLCD